MSDQINVSITYSTADSVTNEKGDTDYYFNAKHKNWTGLATESELILAISNLIRNKEVVTIGIKLAR